MPDISMCSGEGCEKRKSCYRFKAKANEFRQAYFSTPPFDKESKVCEYYWLDEVKKKSKKDLK